MKCIIKLVFFLWLAAPGFAQTLLTPADAVRGALQKHPLAKAATWNVQAKKKLEKAAINLPNPEINAESPTGEFYALGVLQSFDFPTVYARQKQAAKAETSVAQAQQRVGENDLRLNARTLYLEAQFVDFQYLEWIIRDSIYQAIATAANRAFTAGEIDFLQKSLAENEAGKIHQERLAAQQNAALLHQQLEIFTDLHNWDSLLPLDSMPTLSTPSPNHPAVALEQQNAASAAQYARLAKSRALPNFSIGYLNQGPRNTPIDYRFRASIGIPLWAGQYKAATQAAQSETQAAQARAEAQAQEVTLEWGKAQTNAANARAQVQYFQEEALPRSRAIIGAAQRMREAGQVDYLTFLRTISEAFDTRQEYGQQCYEFHLAQIQLLYLSDQ